MLRADPSAPHIGLLVMLAVGLAGCAGDTDPLDTADAPEPTAIAVRGVASCAELPQRVSSDPPGTDRLPALVLPCLTPGPAIDLSTLGGRPVLVNLWASWCGPCREEMPVLQATHEQYGEQVQFLGVNTEDRPEAAAALLDDLGITYPHVADVEGEFLTDLAVPGIPVTVLLDADGLVAQTHVGQLDAASIADFLAGVLD